MKRWRFLTVAAVVGVAALAGPAIAVRADSGPDHTVESAPHRPVGIVLGARVQPSGPSPYLQARIDLGIELYRSGKVDRLIMSGDDSAEALHEPTTMKLYAIDRGVPAQDITVDPAGLDTYDTCVRARDEYGATAVTMITQSYHLPRAVATCRWVGLDVIGVGDESVRGPHPRSWWYGVARELLANWKMLIDVASGRPPAEG
ncbi:SanA/YdcF family protein [Parenemella sanctibonifatiensis]|uniref:DUF218 domain-containing protein n=1 Tax=Parenemella sanctibonifatiensis TaxID=2016505 RepID=A0A255EHH6_9ACTN|nr:ElyC/SanA/YdcF family protein [Parenemella sanctibonifatiensis]OYN88882.1 hypothetical protein CGZ92_04055 [Parenemella sanctibonifatiensis]